MKSNEFILPLSQDKIEKSLEPSAISKNYSGTSVFFTPEPLISCILNGIDYFLKKNFQIDEGILNPELNFLDPAAGLLAFPLGLIDYVKLQVSPEIFDSWLDSFLQSRFLGFEIDSIIHQQGHDLLNFKYKQLKNDYHNNKNIDMDDVRLIDPTRNLLCFDTLSDNSNGTHNDLTSFISKSSNIRNSLTLRKNFPNSNSSPLIVFGNPPYAVSSRSKSNWIRNLVEDYKTELQRPGTKRILGLKGIQDDYVKFIRFGQYKLCDQKHPGILAYVVNNYFLDGAIFRGMRISLSRTFDEIWIVNLHGDPKKNSIKKISNHSGKITPEYDASIEKDENVFDIQTGICLLFAINYNSTDVIKKNRNNGIAKVYYSEIFGDKERKFRFLSQTFEQIKFHDVFPRIDFEYIPISKDMLELEKIYSQYVYLPDIFQKNILGIQSLHDSLITHPDRQRLEKILTNFHTGSYKKHEFKDNKNQTWVKHNGVTYHDARDWKISDGMKGSLDKSLKNIMLWRWRGFDSWWVSYDSHLMTRGSSSYSLMQYMIPGQKNIAIGCSRVSRKDPGENSVFITDTIVESHFIEGGSGIGDYIFPLKINQHPSKKSDWECPLQADSYNFNPKIYDKLAQEFTFSEEDLFYYIYGILWCPQYRKRFQFLLKQDFPRIPLPSSQNCLNQFSKLGKKLANYHIMRNDNIQIFDQIAIQPSSKQSEIINLLKQKSNELFLKISGFSYNLENNHIEIQGETFKGDQISVYLKSVSKYEWDFEVGGIQQLALWLKHRTYQNIEFRKYAFTREITFIEFRYFIKIYESIKKTIKLQYELDQIWQKEVL